MKKYRLDTQYFDPISGDELPVIINGQNLANREIIFDKGRNELDPFPDEFLFSPLLIELYTDDPREKESPIYGDIISWVKNRPRGYTYHVVSQNFKDLLLTFNLQNHKFYKAELSNLKGAVYNYYVLQMLEMPLMKHIDFKHSIFQDGKPTHPFIAGPPRTSSSASSYENLLEIIKEKEWRSYDIKVLAVKDSFWELDLLFVNNHGLLCSQRLVDALQSSDLSGFSFKEATFNFYKSEPG